jgi:hypothetical protein
MGEWSLSPPGVPLDLRQQRPATGMIVVSSTVKTARGRVAIIQELGAAGAIHRYSSAALPIPSVFSITASMSARIPIAPVDRLFRAIGARLAALTRSAAHLAA